MLFIQINQFDPRRYIPRIPRENRGELAICIFIAFLFWLIISLTTNDHSVSKPVEIEFVVGEDEVLIEPLTAMAEATISGPGWELMWSNVFQPVIKISYYRNRLDNKVVNQVDISSAVTDALYSSETSLTKLIFLPVTLRVEPKASKKVPVRSQITVKYKTGYSPKSSPEFTPDSVVVWGGESLLNNLKSWSTDTLNITEVDANLQQMVKLTDGADGLMPATTTVEFRLEVEVVTEKSLYVPVEVVNPPAQDSFSIFPKQVRLKVGVLESDYNQISANDFRLVADLNGMRAEDGRNTIPLLLDRKPAEALSVTYTPKAAEFFLFKKE